MKKWITMIIIMTLISGCLFTMPAQAYVGIIQLSAYVNKQPGSGYGVERNHYCIGSEEYWRVRIFEEKSWVGANRPERLMGDANIDGKVDARDALFALNFGLYGNVQTRWVGSPPKTPYSYSWQSSFYGAYNRGTLEGKTQSDVFWWEYCRYNSPFFADVTKDCVVNVKDALEILKYSVGKAENFPVGDFTTVSRDFNYYPWPTEYYPGIFNDLRVDITFQEFCEKYNFSLDVSPTDK